MISRPIGAIAIGTGILVCAHEAGHGLTAPQGREVGDARADVGWCWPVAMYRDYKPVISDGPGNNKRDGGTRSHNGADIDFKRRSKSDLLDTFKIGTREASSGGWYFCPQGWPVVAARDGKIWSCTTSERGLQIVIDHGKPYCTYYQHLSRVFVEMRRGAKDGQPVKAGQVIGLTGNGYQPGSAAANGFTHLHFEIWKDGGAANWIDPTPILTAQTTRYIDEKSALSQVKP